MFSECSSLLSLLDISNWNINNLKNKDHMFKRCNKSSNIHSNFQTKGCFDIFTIK